MLDKWKEGQLRVTAGLEPGGERHLTEYFYYCKRTGSRGTWLKGLSPLPSLIWIHKGPLWTPG